MRKWDPSQVTMGIRAFCEFAFPPVVTYIQGSNDTCAEEAGKACGAKD